MPQVASNDRFLRLPTLSSSLGVKGSLRVRAYGNVKHAHIVLRKVDEEEYEDENGTKRIRAVFSLFAHKLINVKAGKELYLYLHPPNGDILEYPIAFEGELGEDDEVNQPPREVEKPKKVEDPLPKEQAMPPKMRKLWARKSEVFEKPTPDMTPPLFSMPPKVSVQTQTTQASWSSAGVQTTPPPSVSCGNQTIQPHSKDTDVQTMAPVIPHRVEEGVQTLPAPLPRLVTTTQPHPASPHDTSTTPSEIMDISADSDSPRRPLPDLSRGRSLSPMELESPLTTPPLSPVVAERPEPVEEGLVNVGVSLTKSPLSPMSVSATPEPQSEPSKGMSRSASATTVDTDIRSSRTASPILEPTGLPLVKSLGHTVRDAKASTTPQTVVPTPAVTALLPQPTRTPAAETNSVTAEPTRPITSPSKIVPVKNPFVSGGFLHSTLPVISVTGQTNIVEEQKSPLPPTPAATVVQQTSTAVATPPPLQKSLTHPICGPNKVYPQPTYPNVPKGSANMAPANATASSSKVALEQLPRPNVPASSAPPPTEPLAHRKYPTLADSPWWGIAPPKAPKALASVPVSAPVSYSALGSTPVRLGHTTSQMSDSRPMSSGLLKSPQSSNGTVPVSIALPSKPIPTAPLALKSQTLGSLPSQPSDPPTWSDSTYHPIPAKPTPPSWTHSHHSAHTWTPLKITTSSSRAELTEQIMKIKEEPQSPTLDPWSAPPPFTSMPSKIKIEEDVYGIPEIGEHLFQDPMQEGVTLAQARDPIYIQEEDDNHSHSPVDSRTEHDNRHSYDVQRSPSRNGDNVTNGRNGVNGSPVNPDVTARKEVSKTWPLPAKPVDLSLSPTDLPIRPHKRRAVADTYRPGENNYRPSDDTYSNHRPHDDGYNNYRPGDDDYNSYRPHSDDERYNNYRPGDDGYNNWRPRDKGYQPHTADTYRPRYSSDSSSSSVARRSWYWSKIHTAQLHFDGSTGIRGITFNSTGSQFAVICQDHTIRIWNSTTRAEVAKLAHNASVVSIAWMRGDTGVVSLGLNGVVNRWTRVGQNQWHWAKVIDAGDTDPVCMAYRDDRIAIANARFGVKVWLWAKSHWQPQVMVQAQSVTKVKWVDEGDVLIGGTVAGDLWRCRIPNKAVRQAATFKTKVFDINMDPEGDHAIVAQAGGTAHLVSLAQPVGMGLVQQVYSTRDVEKLSERANHAFGALFTAQGQLIAFGSIGRRVLLWDREEGKVACELDHGNDVMIQAVASFDSSSSDSYLITGNRQGRLTWWSPEPRGSSQSLIGVPSKRRRK